MGHGGLSASVTLHFLILGRSCSLIRELGNSKSLTKTVCGPEEARPWQTSLFPILIWFCDSLVFWQYQVQPISVNAIYPYSTPIPILLKWA